jgi:kynurenine 3-monooxygenase
MSLWNNEHRVLFSRPGATQPGMDPGVHYIFGGLYTAVVKLEDGQEMWTAVTAANDNASAAERALLLSDTPSPANISALRDFLTAKAPGVAGFFDDTELARYFTRRTFRGAVVKVNKLNFREWIVLLGDAAHSVLPATGEGINSGLEDTEALLDAYLANPASWFEQFNSARGPDTASLGELATYLNPKGWAASPPEGASRLGFQICGSILEKMGCFGQSYMELTFGGRAVERMPYRDIVDHWHSQQCCVLPCCRCCCYPTVSVCYLLASPFLLLKALFACGARCCASHAPSADEEKLLATRPVVKPPVGSV